MPIMKLLSHTDSDVRNQALLTLQKVMITNWYVAKLSSYSDFRAQLTRVVGSISKAKKKDDIV